MDQVNSSTYSFIQPTHCDSSKNKAGLCMTQSLLRCVCNHGLKVAKGKDFKVYAQNILHQRLELWTQQSRSEMQDEN